MIDHDEARVLAGALADGEAVATPDFDAHLASCADCAAFLRDLERLSVLTAALPREHAPASLADRVLLRIRRRRMRVRLAVLAPVVAAATAVAVVLSVLPGPGTVLVPLPPAAAAERLLTLRSLYVERTVSAGEFTTKERIWWRAPGYVRIESADSLTILTPAFRYEEGVLTENVAPSITLPEPLSPTVALLGDDVGAGPAVAGQPTRRYRLTFGDQTRDVFVATGIGLGGRETVVVQKAGGPTVKTTQVLQVDPEIDDALFAPPPGAKRDGMFDSREVGDLDIAPRGHPEGFRVVRAGRGPFGEAVLYVRGSLPVLVTSSGLPRADFGEVRSVEYGGESYLVQVDLYAPPAVRVPVRGGSVTVSAPLPVDSLVRLAAEMYRE